jgi:hypothetical protein
MSGGSRSRSAEAVVGRVGRAHQKCTTLCDFLGERWVFVEVVFRSCSAASKK